MAEKPMARTVAETADIVAAAAQNQVQLGICYQNRYHPLVQQARDFYQQGLLGDLMTVEIRQLTTQVQHRLSTPWMFQHQHAGGGMLAWLGCHYLDLMHYVIDDDVVAVSAEVATRGGTEIDVEDVAALTLRFRSGAVGTLHVGYTLALKGARYGDTPHLRQLHRFQRAAGPHVLVHGFHSHHPCRSKPPTHPGPVPRAGPSITP